MPTSQHMIKIARQVSFTLYAILIIVMALATFFEQFYGTEAAHECIYASWWFYGLWAAALATSALCIHKHLRWLLRLSQCTISLFRRLLRYCRHRLPQKKMMTLVILFIAHLCLPTSASSVQIRTAERLQAEEMKRAQVVYNGRICPLNTPALDFIRKLTGKTSFRSLTAEQVLLSWSLYPEDWKNVDMIRVKNDDVRHQLGIKGNMACFADFFDSYGHYLLEEGKYPNIDDKLTTIVLLTRGELYTPIISNSHMLSPTKTEAEIIYNTVPWQPILIAACFLLAILSFAVTGRRAECRVKGFVVAAQALLTTVLLFSLLLRWYVSGHCPLTSTYETLQVVALTALLASFFFPSYRLASLLVAGSSLLVSHLSSLNPQITAITPALDSPWLSSHVTTIMLSYSLFALLLFRPARSMLLAAELLLATGIILGAIWAKTAWGSYWQWDPKETWALITLLIYMFPLHPSSLPWFANPRHMKAYLRLAFLSVLMTYFGCNYILTGLHSYAG